MKNVIVVTLLFLQFNVAEAGWWSDTCSWVKERANCTSKYLRDRDPSMIPAKNIDKINDHARDRIDQLNDHTRDRIDQIGSQTKDSINQLNDHTRDRIDQIGDQTNKAINHLNDHTRDRIDQINNHTKDAINLVNNHTKDRVDQIANHTKDSINLVNNHTKDRVDQVDGALQKNIQLAGDQGRALIQELGDELENKGAEIDKKFSEYYTGFKNDAKYAGQVAGGAVVVAGAVYGTVMVVKKVVNYRSEKHNIINSIQWSCDRKADSKLVTYAILFERLIDCSYQDAYCKASNWQTINPFYPPYSKYCSVYKSNSSNFGWSKDLLYSARNAVADLEMASFEDIEEKMMEISEELLLDYPTQIPVAAKYIRDNIDDLLNLGDLSCYRKDVQNILRKLRVNIMEICGKKTETI